MEGLIGLRQNIQSRESKMQELSVLERMTDRIEKDRNNEILAQEQEQMFYEKMYAQADQLLEKDRKAINSKIRMFQKQTTDSLRKYGGSKMRFMQNGGVSHMNRISNDIMRSDEVIRYQDNRKNMAKILEAKEKGLGHLLSPRDLSSLKAYEDNEEGAAITYSGIMAEIEIPPSQNFDYGTEIPIENILTHGSNAMKIRNNYSINYPDAPEPSYLELIAFAKKMGYGGTGSNTMRLRQSAAAAKQRAAYERKTSTKKDKNKISFLNEFNVVKSNETLRGLRVQDIDSKFNGDVINHLKEKGSSVSKLVGNKFEHMSRNRHLSEEGLDWQDIRKVLSFGTVGDNEESIFEWAFDEKIGLKGAYEILPMDKYKVTNRAFESQYEVKDGKILNFTPTDDMFRMDGVMLKGRNKLDKDDHTGNYSVLGISTAFKAPMESDEGKDVLLVNAYNDNGTLDEKATKEINDAYGNPEAQLTTVVALQNEAGDIFYKEIDLSKNQIKQVMSNELGDDDDLTESVEQEKESYQKILNISKNTTEEQIKFKSAINDLDEKVFQDPLFKMEGEKYFGSYSGGQENRYPLMKSFYMAFDYINNSYKRDEQNPEGDPNVHPTSIQALIDSEIFTTAAISGDIENDLKSYEQGNDERSIITKWLSEMNSDQKEGSLGYQKNQELSSKWMQLLKMM